MPIPQHELDNSKFIILRVFIYVTNDMTKWKPIRQKEFCPTSFYINIIALPSISVYPK